MPSEKLSWKVLHNEKNQLDNEICKQYKIWYNKYIELIKKYVKLIKQTAPIEITLIHVSVDLSSSSCPAVSYMKDEEEVDELDLRYKYPDFAERLREFEDLICDWVGMFESSIKDNMKIDADIPIIIEMY